MVKRLKDLIIHIMKSNMSLLQAQVIFVKDTGMKVRMDCARLTHHGPLRLGNEKIMIKGILNRIAFNIGYAYAYVKIRCKLIKEKNNEYK